MTDKELKEIEKLFAKFNTFDEFINKVYHGESSQNSGAIKEMYDAYKLGLDAWEMMKYFRSSETLRIDREQRKNDAYKIEDILNFIKKHDLSKYKRVIITLDNIDYDNIDELLKLNIEVFIDLKGDTGLCTIEEFKNVREFFTYFRNTYSKYDLSPLEKITLAYDYCKFYLYMDEENGRKTESHAIAKILETGNIVCAGYSVIFCQLLKELGIDNTYLFAIHDDLPGDDHMRVIVDVKDPKYHVSNLFIFDPTWDSEHEMMLVSNNSQTSYKMKEELKKDDIVIKKLPSWIMYLFYMINLYEFRKYFPEEEIMIIKKYGSEEPIKIEGLVKEAFEFNDKKPRDDWTVNLIKEILPKIKKIEGYNDDEIKEYVNDAVNIMYQYRFGLLDKYRGETPGRN